MPQIANRLRNLEEYVFSTIGEKINKLKIDGADVIRLDIGNPDLPPEDTIISALADSASKHNSHGYSGYRGIASFRESVARFYQKRFGVILDAETEILPLIGTKEGIINLTFAYIDADDIALVPSIGYPSYAMGTKLAGGRVEYISMHPDTFLLELSKIAPSVLDKAKLLWLNYPNNPTGATAPISFFEEVIDLCAKHDIIAVSDNPYVDITYTDFCPPSILGVDSAKQHAVEFFSMSKTYNMAGWRIGAAVGNQDVLKHLLKMKSNVDSGHFKAIYDSASLALDTISPEWINQRNNLYRQRRDKLYNSLSSFGLSAQLPDATLYIWAKIPPEFEDDDVRFTDVVLNEAHVSIAPGSAYGPAGNGYVRLSVSVPDERLVEAIERLQVWYSQKHTG